MERNEQTGGPKIELMGPVRILDKNCASTGVLPRKSQALLAYLCLSGGRDVARDELVAMLWPLSENLQGRASLRNELSGLRKRLTAVGLEQLSSTNETVTLRLPEGTVDAVALSDPASALKPDQAQALYKGHFLQDLKLWPGSFEDWVTLARQRLKNLAVGIVASGLTPDLSSNERQKNATFLLSQEPAHEAAYRCLMALNRETAPDMALRLYQECEVNLRRDLDAPPSFETRALAEKIRQEMFGESPETQKDNIWAAVVALDLDWPAGREVNCEHVHQAQQRFFDVLEQQAADTTTTLLTAFGGQAVLVFHSEDRQDAALRAAQTAHGVVEMQFGLEPGFALHPRAGLAVGPVLLMTARGEKTAVGATLNDAIVARDRASSGQIWAAKTFEDYLPEGAVSKASTSPTGRITWL